MQHPLLATSSRRSVGVGRSHTTSIMHPSLLRRSSPLILFLAVAATIAIVPSSAVKFTSSSNPNPYTSNGGVYDHTFGLFAPDPSTYNITGRLYYDPLQPTFCEAPNNPGLVRGQIVFALRSKQCEFITRAKLAEALGAKGLIIADNQPNIELNPTFLGPPPEENPQVNIPVIYVTTATRMVVLGGGDGSDPDSPWRNTTAIINQDGLRYTMQDYRNSVASSSWDAKFRLIFNLCPFILVLMCYYSWYKTAQRPSRPQAAAPVVAPAQPQQPLPVEGIPVSAAQQNPGAAQHVIAPFPQQQQQQSSEFGEHEMTNLSQNASTTDASTGGASGLSDVALDVVSSPRVRESSVEEHKSEREGLMGPGSANSSASSSHSLARPLLLAGGRPSVQPQGPSVSPTMRFYYHTLKALSAAGKPKMIFRFNMTIYLIHALSAIIILISGWKEKCGNENLAMVSLWCARALIGIRICYWQCNSHTSVPTCADIFLKNWSDCIYLFTGSMFTWSQSQREDCELNAPTIYHAIQVWTIVIYITYGSRLIVYLCDKYSQTHSASLPHIFTIAARSGITIINGGFSCAGALDKGAPATQLDLMLIPTVTYHDGMYPPDDAVCGVCLGDYAQGETLRVLNCSHHFHQACVDTWLLQKSTCPTCRASLDGPQVRRGAGSVQDVEEDEIEGEQRQQSSSQQQPLASVNQQRPPSPSNVDGRSRNNSGDAAMSNAQYHRAQPL